MRENKKHILNKGFVGLRYSLIATILIGLVLFMFNVSFVRAYEPCPPETLSTTPPVCHTNADCDDGNPCTDDVCVCTTRCDHRNNNYKEERECGSDDCLGKQTRTCSDGSFGEWTDCSTKGDICGDCPGLDGWNDCLFDHIDYTLDKYLRGDMLCSAEGICSTDSCEYEHRCADHDAYDGPDGATTRCFAECDQNKDCPSYCDGDIRYLGSCDFWPGDCSCNYDPYDCNNKNGWVDTGNTQWVEVDQCSEKEQKEQEYRDYYCGQEPSVDCYYSVTGTQWVDTGNTRNKNEGTVCDDGKWCTLDDECNSGICVGSKRDCSDENACTDDTCDEDNDQCIHTHLDVNSPETTKTYGDPIFIDGIYDWITTGTPITLNAVDYGIDHTQECAKGVDKIYYRYCLNSECYEGCDSIVPSIVQQPVCECPEETPWLELTDSSFTIPEDSEHCIEFYAVDKLVDQGIIEQQNVEPVKSQCVYVDDKDPTAIKIVGEPNAKWDGKDSHFYPGIGDLCWNSIDCWKVTKETQITMSCVDQDPHPVGIKELCYKVDLDGNDATENYCTDELKEGWCCVQGSEKNLLFKEDSEHELEFYCVDKLDHESSIDIEKFKVYGGKFDIKLNFKWNLISVPFVLFSDDPKDVFENIKDDVLLVLTYDAEDPDCVANDGWCVYIPSSETGTIKHIKPGWGYWILTKKETVLTVVGSLMHEGETPPSRGLVEGWNLIGYYGTDNLSGYDGPDGDGKQAFCALHSLVNLLNPIPTEWDALITYWNGAFIDLDACKYMDPGAGYWIGMNVPDSDYRYATDCSGNTCN